ncbi:MAG TPA: uroporphyrinogen-III C-methyltransferase [Pirellulales bacterium]|jgi:uroporphyrinogen III methyltransferase/synthase|nr:uroporphyrinogen-III C-methyltransferase [Pirellulales bacterium]
MANQRQICPGRVYLVGAGPGDPGLITLRGVECLGEADEVLYDYLVNPRILDHAPSAARRVCLGRHGRDRLLSQDEINRLLIDAAWAGSTVVRLKGGDPAIFGRLADEAAALVEAGVPIEIVPGITAVLAAGSYAGIPLTDRQHASAVALVTGRQSDSEPPSSAELAALAQFPGTLVFYMGTTTAAEWTSGLIAAGKPADTPAVIVRRCTWPDQLTIGCTLGTVADEVARRKLRPPAIVVVGEVASAADAAINWFVRRSLHGVRVLVTRPRGQAVELSSRLERLGAEVLAQPAIEILPPDDWAPVDRALGQIADYDWLVFSSANGVRMLLDRLEHSGGDLRRLGSVRLAAIGPGTADALADYHLRADVQPEEFRAEALAAALAGEARGRRFLLARASRGREVLAEQLRAAGGLVEQVVVYRSEDVRKPDPEVAAALAAGKIDFVTVTSSAIARSLAAMFGPGLAKSRLASISPITSATLRELGFEAAAEARQYTLEGVVEAIVNISPRRVAGGT